MLRSTVGISLRLQVAGSADPGRITATPCRTAAAFHSAASLSATRPCGGDSQISRPTGSVPGGSTATVGSASSAASSRTTRAASSGPASGSSPSAGAGRPAAGTSSGGAAVTSPTVDSTASRRYPICTRSPGDIPASIPARASGPASGVTGLGPCWMVITVSPGRSPAWSAGPSGSTQPMVMPPSGGGRPPAAARPRIARRQGGSFSTSVASRVTREACGAPAMVRSTSTVSVSPAYRGEIACRASAIRVIGLPSMATRRSPGSNPARAAGESGCTVAISGAPLIASRPR